MLRGSAVLEVEKRGLLALDEWQGCVVAATGFLSEGVDNNERGHWSQQSLIT